MENLDRATSQYVTGRSLPSFLMKRNGIGRSAGPHQGKVLLEIGHQIVVMRLIARNSSDVRN